MHAIMSLIIKYYRQYVINVSLFGPTPYPPPLKKGEPVQPEREDGGGSERSAFTQECVSIMNQNLLCTFIKILLCE